MIRRLVLALLVALAAPSAWAAFPTVASTATTTGSTAAVNATVNLPGSIVSGNTLLVLVRKSGEASLSFPAGWTELFDDVSDASDDASVLAWRKADGTEGATITVTGAASTKYAAGAWQISGAADPTVSPPEFATLVIGNSNNPDPGSLTPSGGAKDYLWFALEAHVGESALPPTFPTNYTANQLSAGSGIAGVSATNVRVAGATRELNATSEDPGTYTFTDIAQPWTATTVAVYPAPPSVTTGPGWGYGAGGWW